MSKRIPPRPVRRRKRTFGGGTLGEWGAIAAAFVGILFLALVWIISVVGSLAISVAVIALVGDLINLWDVVSWI